jgi:CRISPR-associated protein Cmr5
MNDQNKEVKTIDMQRAEHAYGKVDGLKRDGSYGKYVSYVKGLPATILQNGLGQAMATLLAASKGKPDAHRYLYDHVEEWLCNANSYSPYYKQNKQVSNGDLLMKKITEGDENAYIYAQAEALAYLVWLKKFAVAYLEEKED